METELLRDKLIAYYRKQETVVSKNLAKAKRSDREKPVKKFRVAIKKIRATLLLTEGLAPDRFQAKPHLETIKLLYKSAGCWRDAQVHARLTRAYQEYTGMVFPNLLVYLQEQELAGQKEFTDRLKSFDLYPLHLSGNVLAFSLRNLSEEQLAQRAHRLAGKLFDTIRSHRKNFPDEETLHEIRRWWKEGMYIFAFTGLDPTQVHPEMTTERLKEVARIIGAWHDRVMLLERLSQFELVAPEAAAAPNLIALRHVILEEVFTSLQEIRTVLRAL